MAVEVFCDREKCRHNDDGECVRYKITLDDGGECEDYDSRYKQGFVPSI